MLETWSTYPFVTFEGRAIDVWTLFRRLEQLPYMKGGPALKLLEFCLRDC